MTLVDYTWLFEAAAEYGRFPGAGRPSSAELWPNALLFCVMRDGALALHHANSHPGRTVMPNELQQVQHPIVRRVALTEMIWQLFILGGAVAAFQWFNVRFELSLLLLLVLGFSRNTLNVMGASMRQNVHLAEIRDLLVEQSDRRVR
jgi:hypothetical protein